MPEIVTDKKGKQRRAYRRYATPWELLQQVREFAAHLKRGVTPGQLQQRVGCRSDTQAAREMEEAKQKLLARLRQRRSA